MYVFWNNQEVCQFSKNYCRAWASPWHSQPCVQPGWASGRHTGKGTGWVGGSLSARCQRETVWHCLRHCSGRAGMQKPCLHCGRMTNWPQESVTSPRAILNMTEQPQERKRLVLAFRKNGNGALPHFYNMNSQKACNLLKKKIITNWVQVKHSHKVNVRHTSCSQLCLSSCWRGSCFRTAV